MLFIRDLFGDKLVIGWQQKWLQMREICQELADRLVAKFHYSGKACIFRLISLGIFHNDNPDKIEGVVQLSGGIKPQQKSTWGPDVTGDNSVEFDRMWLSDDLPKFSETIVLSMVTKFVKRRFPNIKYILSYADGSTGRDGTIYKAGNYEYIGKIKADFYILASGERVHPVSMWHRHGTRKWSVLTELYPGISKACGYQYRFLMRL